MKKIKYKILKIQKITVALYLLFVLFIFYGVNIFSQTNINLNDIDYLFKNRLYSDVIVKINFLLLKSKTKDYLRSNFFNFDDNDKLNYYLGVSYFYLKKYDKALLYLKKISNPLFLKYFDPVNYYIGTIYYDKGDFENAFQFYNSIVNNKDIIKNKINFYYNFAVCQVKSGNYNIAINLLKKGLDFLNNELKTEIKKRNYYIPFYIYSLANVYYLNNQYDLALQHFSKIVKNYPDFELADDSIFYSGKIYFDNKDYINSKKEFLSLIYNYKDSEFYYDSMFYLGKITGNRQYYKIIIDNNPEFHSIDFVYYYYAKILKDLDASTSLEFFKKVLNISKNEELIYNSIVNSIKVINKLKESYINKNSKDTNKENNNNNNDSINKYNLMILELLKNNILKSSRKNDLLNYALNLIYNYLLTSYKENNSKNNIDSNTNNYLKDINQYLIFFESLQNKIDFTDKEFYILGKIYFVESNTNESIIYFNKALEISPEQKYYYYLGLSYYNSNNYDKAFNNLEKALKSKQGENSYRLLSENYIGLIYLYNSQFIKALNIFDDLIRRSIPYIDKKSLKYYKLISLYNLKKYKDSLVLIRELMKRFKLSSQLDYDILTYILTILPNLDIEYANALYSIYGADVDKDFSIAYYLSNKYFAIGNYEKSLMYLDYIYKNGNYNNKIDSLIKKYLLYVNLKKYDKAFEVIKVSYDLTKSSNFNYKKSLILRYMIEQIIKNYDKNKSKIDINTKNEIETLFEKLKKLNDISNLLITAKDIYQFYNKYKDYDNALIYLNNIIDLTKKDKDNSKNIDELNFQKVLLLYNLKRYKEALDLIEILIKNYNSNVDRKNNNNENEFNSKITTLKNIKFDILLQQKDVKGIQEFLFDQIKDEKNIENIYFYFSNILILYETNILDKVEFVKLEEILKSKEKSYVLDIFYMFKNFDKNYDFKKFNSIYSKFINSENDKISFWARFLYSIYFYEKNDFKNSEKVLKALLKFDFKYENQLILYYLIKIAQTENKTLKGNEYWKIFQKDYKNSLIYLLKY